VALYFTQLPAKVANDYENRAEPEDPADRRSRKELARLMERSRYRRLIDDLHRREDRIADLFDEL
jgi:hypothetical protein